MDLEEKLRAIRNERGVTLYDHLLNVMGKIMLDQQKNPYTDFERISAELKDSDVFLGYSDSIESLIRENGEDLKSKILDLRRFLKLDQPVQNDENDDEPKQEEEPPANVITNLLAQEKISRRCGISLGEEECYLIQNALKLFSAARNALKCSFWGKILGHQASYYVVEVPNPEKPDGDEVTGIDEAYGTGINSKAYFVTTEILSNNWVELPVISAKQMRQAREITYFFSGDLKKRIIMSPEFDGEERHYVRLEAKGSDCANQLCL